MLDPGLDVGPMSAPPTEWSDGIFCSDGRPESLGAFMVAARRVDRRKEADAEDLAATIAEVVLPWPAR